MIMRMLRSGCLLCHLRCLREDLGARRRTIDRGDDRTARLLLDGFSFFASASVESVPGIDDRGVVGVSRKRRGDRTEKLPDEATTSASPDNDQSGLLGEVGEDAGGVALGDGEDEVACVVVKILLGHIECGFGVLASCAILRL